MRIRNRATFNFSKKTFYSLKWFFIGPFLFGCAYTKNTLDSINEWSAPPLMKSDDNKKSLLAVLGAAPKKGSSEPGNSAVATGYGIYAELAPKELDMKDGHAPNYPYFNEQVASSIASIEDAVYKHIRTDVLNEMKKISNNNCKEYKTDLLQTQARSNFSLGTSALILGSAGALSTGATAARILAGGSALATGIRSEINQDYFYSQTVLVLSKAIDTKQKVSWGIILSKRDVEKQDYSIIEALADIEEYNNVCSLNGALTALENAVDSVDVTKSITDALDNIKKIRQYQAGGDAPQPDNKKGVIPP